MPPPTLPELAEADAPPEIAAIYAQMRERAAAPMVALIWRHLATHPGILEEVWAGLRGIAAAGLLQETAWRTSAAAVTAPPADVTRAKLRAAGLSADQIDGYTRVLDAYNRVNPINFVMVRMLIHRLDAPPTTPAAILPAIHWQSPEPVGSLPPIVPVAALAGEPRRMIDALSSDPAQDRSTMVPTLYRHLTGHAAPIPLIHGALIARFASGEVDREAQRVSSALDAEARRLATHLPYPKLLATRADVRATLDRFTRLIPEMVVVGLLLRRGL